MAAEDVTNTHEGLDAISDEQAKEMANVVDATDHPYDDPITGKPNTDVPHDELGVDEQAKERREEHDGALQMAVDAPEEDTNANQWEDTYMEDSAMVREGNGEA